MTTLLLAALPLTTVFGAWAGHRWARVSQDHDARMARFRCSVDVNDAADCAETAADWAGELL